MKKLLVLLFLSFVLVGCWKKKVETEQEPQKERREVVFYVVTTHTGDIFEIQDPLYGYGNPTLRITQGVAVIEAHLSKNFRGLKQFEVLEIVDERVRDRKRVEALKKLGKDATDEEQLIAYCRVSDENPDGLRVRVILPDGDVLEGIIPTKSPHLQCVTGKTKRGEIVIPIAGIVAITREVKEVPYEQ